MSRHDHLPPEILALAHRLADAAAAITRPYFRRPIGIADKGAGKIGADFDPVTAADREAEEAMRALIAAERPDDAILGEEYGATPGRSGLRWVLDPIDGTRAFITGNQHWGTLIGLEAGGRRVLGVLDQPVLGERFLAHPGGATRRAAEGDAPIAVRACAGLADAVVTTTHPWGYFSETEREGFERVARAARLSRFGGDCYAYALLAMGFTDLVIESSLKAWDVAALVPLVERAGGIITDWNGAPLSMGGDYFAVVAAGDARVHEEAVRMLSTTR